MGQEWCWKMNLLQVFLGEELPGNVLLTLGMRDTGGTTQAGGAELLLFHQRHPSPGEEHPPSPSFAAIMLNLKLLTNEPHEQPLRSTWLFFKSSYSRRKLKFHTN